MFSNETNLDDIFPDINKNKRKNKLITILFYK